MRGAAAAWRRNGKPRRNARVLTTRPLRKSADNLAAAALQPEARTWLHLIDVPSQIIWGESDQLIAPAHATALKRDPRF